MFFVKHYGAVPFRLWRWNSYRAFIIICFLDNYQRQSLWLPHVINYSSHHSQLTTNNFPTPNWGRMFYDFWLSRVCDVPSVCDSWWFCSFFLCAKSFYNTAHKVYRNWAIKGTTDQASSISCLLAYSSLWKLDCCQQDENVQQAFFFSFQNFTHAAAIYV